MLERLENIPLEGRRVLLRVDFNVPVSEGRILDTTRIEQAMPTLKLLLSSGAKVILLTHFGRPKGVDAQFSVKFLLPVLSKMLGVNIKFAETPEIAQTIRLIDGEVLLLENIRFIDGEESNDPECSRRLSLLGDIYVNDAFSCSHRAHASICGITEFLPSYSGLSFRQEIENLNMVVDPKIANKIAVIGGLKVSTKFDALERLLKLCKKVIVGGGMANTFLAAKGYDMADSFVEKELLEASKKLLETHVDKLVLPLDLRCKTASGSIKICDVSHIESGASALDVGPKSVVRFCNELESAQLVLWNGPMGLYENPEFAKSSVELAKHISDLTREGKIHSVLGGGDTMATVKLCNEPTVYSYLSTSGGAFLEWLSGEKLPGLECLLYYDANHLV